MSTIVPGSEPAHLYVSVRWGAGTDSVMVQAGRTTEILTG